MAAIGLPSTRSSATKKSNSDDQGAWGPRDRGGGVVGAQVRGERRTGASAPERCYSLNPCPPCTNTLAARRVSTGSRTPFIRASWLIRCSSPCSERDSPSTSIT